jgi:FKBP-type peptidyl-prolyl cis-trans isomerase FkpA
LVVSLVGTLLASSGCSKLGGGGSVTPQTDDEKTLYAWGLMLGRNAQALSLTPRELEVVKAGLTDSVNKKAPAVELEKFGPKMDTLARNRQNARAEIEKGKAKGILEAAQKESGAQKLPAGTIIKNTRPGTGASPAETDRVKVHYAGRLADGTEFDSSIKRGEPAIFPLNGVIKCWTEGLGAMKVGGKATLTCPSEIAYGDGGRPPVIPGGAVLIFDVELLDIMKSDAPPPAESAPPAGH